MMALLRYGAAFTVSAAFNLAVVVSLAELGQPTTDPDAHESHEVAPSVVEPPPPTPAAPDRGEPTPSSNPLPAAPSPPALDLPAPSDLLQGPSLAWRGLEDVGLGGLDDGLGPVPVEASAPREPDQPPQVSMLPDLARFYPRGAQRRRLGGRSIVAVEVDASGQVVGTEVLRSEPPGVFDAAAEEAARRFRFTPAQRDGRPVAGRTRLELKWQPRN